MYTVTRVAGAWTRMGGDAGTTPMGRLHAVRRVDGVLEREALCGYRIPARAIASRPFATFSVDHPKACPTCIVEVEGDYR